METPKLEIASPRRFTLLAVFGIYACSFLLILPILIAFIIVSVKPLGVFALVIPIAALAVTIYLSPLLGNACVKWLVGRSFPSTTTADGSFIVQITFSPRVRSGFRGFIDDADDIGRLSIAPDALVFEGDSLNLRLPYKQITIVEPQNVGLRGLFVLRRRIALFVAGLPDVEAIEFAERSSCVLTGSGKITRQLYDKLSSSLARS